MNASSVNALLNQLGIKINNDRIVSLNPVNQPSTHQSTGKYLVVMIKSAKVVYFDF